MLIYKNKNEKNSATMFSTLARLGFVKLVHVNVPSLYTQWIRRDGGYPREIARRYSKHPRQRRGLRLNIRHSPLSKFSCSWQIESHVCVAHAKVLVFSWAQALERAILGNTRIAS